MKRNLVCAAALLALSACGNSDANVVENGAANAGEVALRPGKYQIDFVREAMVPGQPSDPEHEVQTQCFSAEDVAHPEKLFAPATESCQQQEAKASKGEFSAHMQCILPEYSASNFLFEIHGTYDGDGAELTGEANVDGVTLRETRSFKRQGDC